MLLYDSVDPLFLSLAFWIPFLVGIKTAWWFSHLKDLPSWRFGALFILFLAIIPTLGTTLHNSYYPGVSYEEQTQILKYFYVAWSVLGLLFGFCFSFNRHAVSQYGYVLYEKASGESTDSYKVSYTEFCQDWWKYRLALQKNATEYSKMATSLEHYFFCNLDKNRSLYNYFDRRELKELSEYLSLDGEQESLLNEYFHNPPLANFKISKQASADYSKTHNT